MKVFIATPMYGGMCTGMYAQSMLQLQPALQSNNIGAMVSSMYNESLITRARNSLVNGFLKTDCTHLLFIDADIRFAADDVVALLKADKDVICGIYPKKEINWQMVEKAVMDDVDVNSLKRYTGSFVINLVDYAPTVTVPMHEPLEIWNGGTGMMAIKREVFEKLKESVPSYSNDVIDLSGNTPVGEKIYEFFATSIEPETNRLLSEDYHFCRIWRLQGGKIYAAPWMNLGHVGTYVFEGELIRTEESKPASEPAQSEKPSPGQKS
jgi:hypothetical protein